MSLYDVKFKIYEGGLGRALEGSDHFSALVVKETRAADKFATVYSVGEAESAGITEALEPNAHYQIAQYFAMAPQGVLYVLLTAQDVESAVVAVQNYAEGNVKQVAVLDSEAFATSTLSALQASATSLEAAHKDLVVLYSTTTVFASTPDLTTLQCPNISVVIGADVSGRIALGAALGTVSLSSVAQNIGAVKFFNVVKSTEYDKLSLADGDAYADKTDAELNSLSNKGYIFLRKYTGFSGSFWNSSATATSATSDFSAIENNRTIQKAKRVVRQALLPELGSPLRAKKGVLDQLTITKFELLARTPLEAMINADELEDCSVVINPAQNVLATSKLTIAVGLTPLGVAKQIEVGIGFEL